MTGPAPLRCTAPHPVKPNWVCNARLADAVPRTFTMRRGADPPPACIAIKCPRCGTRYVVCPNAA